MKIFRSFILILPLLIIGCSDSGDSPTAPSDGGGGGGTVDSLNFVSDIAPLITSNGCLGNGCHGGGASSGGLSLGTGTYADVISASGTNGAIIVVDNASASSFYTKLTATPPFGARMPLGRSPLSTTDLDKIRDWINQGAKEN